MDLEAYVDVVPWLLFVVVDRRAGLGLVWAAVSAMAAGGGIAAWSHWSRRRSPIGWVAVGTFAAMTAVAVVVDEPQPWVEPALRAGSVVVLAAAAFLSLRRRPLSMAYTSDRVPPRRRPEPAFARMNRRITTIWGAAAVLVAASFATIALVPSPVALTVFDWVLPIVIVGGAVRWAAMQWGAYLVASESGGASPLAEASLGGLADPTAPPVRLFPGAAARHRSAVPATGAATGSSPDAPITYLPRVPPGQ